MTRQRPEGAGKTVSAMAFASNTSSGTSSSEIQASQRVSSLIGFLQNRRKDVRFTVWPVSPLVGIAAIVALFAGASMFFFDQSFLEITRNKALYMPDFFEQFTMLGKSKWYLIITGGIVIAFWFLPADKLSRRLLPVWNRSFFTVWFLFYSIAVSGLTGLAIKYLFGRTRPHATSGGNAFNFHPFTAGYDFNSFPSGHSITAGALAMALALLLPKWRWPIFAFWAFIASTRSLIGVHYPSDVITGFAYGLVFTWIYARSMAKHRILFGFDSAGRLELRNTHFAPLKQCFAMFKQAIFGAGRNGINS